MAHARLLTIYNCGTSFNREKGTSLEPGKAGELIAHLYNQCTAPDINNYGRLDLPSYSFKLIHDGPGSAPAAFGTWETNAQGVRQPVHHPASASKAATPGTGPVFSHLPSGLQKIVGMATGKGWEDNVQKAVHAVKALKYRPDAINLIGWSRGAVTCHMIANALLSDKDTSLAQIPVNIFAVDPVPGGRFGKHGNDKVDVGGNVKQYRGVFAIHDRKIGFKAAVVKKKEHDQDIFFYPMPGVHSTVVAGGTGLIAVAALVEHLAVEFLESQGTCFGSGVIHMSPQEICENYAITRKEMRDYEQLSRRGLVPPRWVRTLLGIADPPEPQKGKPAGMGGTDKALGLGGLAPARTNLPGGVEDVEHRYNDLRRAYFVNGHHEEAFEVAFPRAYALLFTPRKSDGALKPDEVKGLYDFHAMQNRCRNSHQQLLKALGS